MIIKKKCIKRLIHHPFFTQKNFINVYILNQAEQLSRGVKKCTSF